jgi:hypothetical protein
MGDTIMSTFAVRAIGFCAHYSPQGDWAFDLALQLARARSLRLNVFHFLTDPYDPGARVPEGLSREERASLAIRLERDLRLYYDDRLGDYLDAGFRLCEDPEWTELHRCLTRREFQLLVLGHPHPGATFGGVPIEDFATSFVSPVVLVGPSSPLEIRLNEPAALIVDRLGLAGRHYTPLHAAAVSGGGDQDCGREAASLE